MLEKGTDTAMTELQFKKLLIDTIKLDDNPNSNEVCELLKIATFRFEKTGQFAYRGVWDQRQEYIYISIIPEKLNELKAHKDYITKMCYEIYPTSDEYDLFDVFYKPGVMADDEEISQEVHFERIQRAIIEQIRDAKYVIWIVMAWFTDPVLYKELLKKKEQGVTIEIVLDDNDKNKNAEFCLEMDFPTHWITIESLYRNIMHEKFCVIDLQTVIHGTFNWTKAANYNKENISIDKNRNIAEQFADEFMRLKKHSH